MRVHKAIMALLLKRADLRVTQLFMAIVVFNIIDMKFMAIVLAPLFFLSLLYAFLVNDLPYIKDEKKLDKMIDEAIE